MSKTRRAIVVGAAGQDGSYLCESLLEDDYEVVGVVRRDPATPIPNLEAIAARVALRRADLADDGALAEIVREVEPHEIYNVASVSFGPDAWAEPVLTAQLGTVPLAQLLEAIRKLREPARLFQASSAWVFGRPSESPQSEATPYAPTEPYGAAKAFGDFLVRAYRGRHDLFACSGILFNHESPRRPERFVTRKVTRAAAAISLGISQTVELGDLTSRRDWGYAPDVVRGARAMLAAEEPDDFVLATGETHSVEELAMVAFRHVGLDWREHVVVDHGPHPGRRWRRRGSGR